MTVWEVGIKQALGKVSGPDDLARKVAEADLRELPVRLEHAVTAAALPPVHRDPFDRMLIAQARHAGLTLATRDAQIQKYDVPVLAV